MRDLRFGGSDFESEALNVLIVVGFLANVFGADSRLAAGFRSLVFLSLGFLSPNDFFSPKVFLSVSARLTLKVETLKIKQMF